MSKKELVLGGARSGKSQFSENRILSFNKKRCFYLATGASGDEEMTERIRLHQKRRGEVWELIEEPIKLAEILTSIDDSSHAILVDCLTLWVSNLLQSSDPNIIRSNKTSLLEALPQLQADILFVSNEVGSGVVPLGKLSRDFVDHAGELHQSLAQICHRVTLVVAGLPLHLKNL